MILIEQREARCTVADLEGLLLNSCSLEFLRCSMHRFDGGGRKWFGNIPDSTANDVLGQARFLFAELSYPASDFWE